MNRSALALALTCALIPAATGLAKPGQKHFDRDKGTPRESYEVRWRDGDDQSHTISFQLQAAAVKRDLDSTRKFPKSDALDAQVAAVRAFARTLDDVKLTAKKKSGGVQIKAKGTSRAKIKKALREADDVREQALDDFLVTADCIRLKGDRLSFDHANLVSEYTHTVRPIARALGERVDSDREYAELALSFVQAIPYEKTKSGSDAGYRRPLGVLARNKGDCDSKAVLYLALLRARDPEMPVAAVYIKDHMLVGVGLDSEKGDKTFRRDGQAYLFAEPVGPAMLDLGDAPGKHRKKVKGASAIVRAAPVRGTGGVPRLGGGR